MEGNGKITAKTLTILPISLLAFLFLASPAYATPSCTPTSCNLKGVILDLGPLGPNPCTGVAGVGEFVVIGNLQSHNTFTFTGDGTIALVNGVTAQVHVTTWDGGKVNSNNQQMEFSAIFQFEAHLSDGTLVGMHSNGHITVNADGTVTANFNFNRLICG